MYGKITEQLPTDAPDSRGLGFTIRAFVDADYAGDLVTRRSRTGFIIFLYNEPIYWYSMKQSGIETSSFGSKFIAMKQCCEYLRGLHFKLRIMRIHVDVPYYVYGDTKSVLVNGSQPF